MGRDEEGQNGPPRTSPQDLPHDLIITSWVAFLKAESMQAFGVSTLNLPPQPPQTVQSVPSEAETNCPPRQMAEMTAVKAVWHARIASEIS